MFSLLKTIHLCRIRLNNNANIYPCDDWEEAKENGQLDTTNTSGFGQFLLFYFAPLIFQNAETQEIQKGPDGYKQSWK